MLKTVYHSSKKFLKDELDHALRIGNLSLESISKDTRYISFDIFDTLIVRDVNKPTDVFKIMEKTLKINNFARKRVEAEQIARKNSKSGEVTIYEIYDAFEGLSDSQAKMLCNTEITIESELCHASPEMLRFFNKCKQKYKVILISDMYMTSSAMRNLLDRCGIIGYEKLYISCEIGCSKGDNGKLYDYVVKNLGISANMITHVGNDISADVLRAKSRGLNAIKVKTNPKNLISRASCPKACSSVELLQRSMIYNFINNTTHGLGEKYDFYYRFGYENFGVLLWGFCKWLFKEIQNDGIEQVLFVARDGYMIKKVYDKMGFDKIIPSHYFEMSRRSIRVAASFSKALSYEDMLALMPLPSRSSIEQIFDAWGLSFDEYSNTCYKLGISKSEVFWTINLKSNDRIKRLYEVIKKNMIDNALDEYTNMLAYVNQFSLDKKTALVDIGWGATIQKELLKALKSANIQTNINGYYIALDKRTNFDSNDIDLKAKGYLWDNYNGIGDPMEEKTFVGLFESFFLENNGSIKKYVVADGKYIAERYPYEYLLPGGILDETTLVHRIQDGAVAFVEAVEKCYVGRFKKISSTNAFLLLRDCMMNPTLEIVKKFGDFRFFNSGEETYLARPKKSLIGYGLHPKQMIADFYESQWKIGFFKALFKVDISYEQLWRFLKLIFPVAPV